MTQERKEALELLWQTYPQDKVFFLTSDNQAFRLENDARNHGKTLEDTTVDKCERTPSSAGQKPAKKPAKVKEDTVTEQTTTAQTQTEPEGEKTESEPEQKPAKKSGKKKEEVATSPATPAQTETEDESEDEDEDEEAEDEGEE